MKLNLGCGDVAPDGWENVDNAVGARLRKIPVLGRICGRFLHSDWSPSIVLHDLRKRFPWADGSVDYVYSSHSLEHLTRSDGEHAVREIFRVLRPGGIARIVMPDLRHEVDRYVAGQRDARDFLRALNAADVEDWPLAKRLYALLSGQGHRCLYDAESLGDLLSACGFAASRKAPFESAIPGIAEIEGKAQTEDALIMEGVKPAR